MSGGRVLFQVRNRRGLGHQMRVQNIALALREVAPDLVVGCHASRPPAPELWDPALPVTHDGELSWRDRAATFGPDVVVYDTVLPHADARLAAPHARSVFVMRGRSEDRTAELVADPFLDQVDAIVVPHGADEADRPDRCLPEHLLPRVHVVGTIGRRPRAEHVAAARARHVGVGELLLTSTVGGGGFREQADRFFGAVLHTAHRVAATMPHVRHVVVLGPNYDHPAMADALAAVPRLEVVRVEPALADLLAGSDLVIAEGGYNTVTEVRLAAVPAVFVPSERGLDDQAARVAALADLGAARVWSPAGDVVGLGDTVLDLLDDPSARAAMRTAHARRPVELGNQRAAVVIAAVARRAALVDAGLVDAGLVDAGPERLA